MNSNQDIYKKKMTPKLWVLITTIFIFIILMFWYLINVYNIINTDIRLPSKIYTKKNIAVRGSIITKDNFQIVKSTQVFKVIIDTRFLDPNKQELFISLFSIYSSIEETIIRDKINNQKNKGRLVLTYNIDSRTVANLNQLKSKLLQLKVFIPLIKKSSFIIGMDISISGDKRVYPYVDALTPLTGYIKKYENSKNITRLKGIKGVEKFNNKELGTITNGMISGQRDIVGDIVLNNASRIIEKSDGKSIKLNIPLKLQKEVELILDKYKEKFEAKEILVSVMNSVTGEVLILATSNRYNPKNILQDQVSFLNLSAIEHQFEPGSIIKPITMALVFDANKVKQGELLDAFNDGKRNRNNLYPKGRYKIDRHTIRDDHRFEKRYITPKDTIVYSSNIGTLQLAQRLTGLEFLNGFKSFGLSKKTGIDLPYEKKGIIHSLRQYQAYEDQERDNVFKATDSYGQGITSTFMQVLKAFTVFNNDGYITTPRIVSSIVDTNNNIVRTLHKTNNKKVISSLSAHIIKNMLIETVNIGTGKGTKIDGLEIGGKTGTAQIARNGKYQREYISSFFGFANDKTKKYTIGVTVFEPSWKYHYASSSAVHIFKDTVEILAKQGYLEKM